MGSLALSLAFIELRSFEGKRDEKEAMVVVSDSLGCCRQRLRVRVSGEPQCHTHSKTIMAARNTIQSLSTATTGVDALSLLAEPPTRHVDGAAMDYFLIELVQTIRQSSIVATARQKKIEQEMIQAGFVPPSAAQTQAKKDALGLSGESPNAARNSNGKSKESEEDESVRVRLEAIGVHVGANFTERYVCSSLSIGSSLIPHTKVMS